MRGWFSRIIAGVAVLAVAVFTARAEEKTGVNQASADAAKEAKVSAEAEAIQKLALANSLIQYGRKNKAPEVLITAARILSETSTVDATAKPTNEVDPKADKVASKSKPAVDNSPKALLEEAKKLSGNDASIVALANSLKMARGTPGGPKVHSDMVAAFSTDTYRLTFVGGEVARVAISGDGDTRLDLYVYDANGNLVASQVGPGDACLASWVPNWTGVFVIRVVNRGRVSNAYAIATN